MVASSAAEAEDAQFATAQMGVLLATAQMGVLLEAEQGAVLRRRAVRAAQAGASAQGAGMPLPAQAR